jgi:hypothetical protein
MGYIAIFDIFNEKKKILNSDCNRVNIKKKILNTLAGDGRQGAAFSRQYMIGIMFKLKLNFKIQLLLSAA